MVCVIILSKVKSVFPQEMLEEQLWAREEDKWRMIDHWERRGCVPLTFPLRGSTSAPDPLHLPALSRAGGGGPAGSTHMSLYSGIGETLKHGPNLKLGCHCFLLYVWRKCCLWLCFFSLNYLRKMCDGRPETLWKTHFFIVVVSWFCTMIPLHWKVHSKWNETFSAFTQMCA